MAFSGGSSTAGGGYESSPLDIIVQGVVDYQGRPVLRSNFGGWRSAVFIIGVEVAERFAYFGISSNLINYLTGPLGQSTATAAENVNAWTGTAMLLPLLGAFVADSYLGRYHTIIMASLLYILGLGLLILSATLPSVSCKSNKTMCPTEFQVILFFFSLYLVAIAQAGHRPCVQALGADQFDEQDSEESKAKSSFFNWWNFGLCGGSIVTNLIVSYIQENLSWVLGFGIPCIVMLIALVVFLLGSITYRYSATTQDKKSPFVRIGRVFGAAFRNRRTSPSTILATENMSLQCSQQFKSLNKALLAQDDNLISVAEVEEAKAVLRLFPIWGSCLVYSILSAQASTFFVKQGTTMDRNIISGFKIPAAYLQSFICLAFLIFIPIYDRLFIPLARAFTGKPSGITMLQRIGTGLSISTLCMIVAALVEKKRLKMAQQYGLVDMPSETIPMGLWWLVPQYLLLGISDVFAYVGLQEFFYDQVPNELRSIGLALYLSILGVGNFLSSILVSIIDQLTRPNTWFSNNLNRAHLDYFYWLLAGFSAIGFAVYLYFTRSYIYKGGRTH